MLSELQVKNVRPKEKNFMLRDDRGLHLRVDKSGRKYWILRYWEQKKEHQLSLGPYPDLSLKDARIMRDGIQTDRAKGKSPTLKTTHIPLRLNKYILPALGAWPLKDITSGNILHLCRKVEDTGHDETAKRVKAIIGQIYRFAIASGYTDTDPTSALLGALRPRNNKHYATLTNPSEIAILMKAMKASGSPV